MTERKLEEMSKQELIRELEKLRIAQQRSVARTGEPDRERLIHDLEVHQVELEMQNRELREAQQRLEEATSRYADLYDFAPVGYCTLDPQGVILEINLAGAALLGAPRGELLGKPFASVAPLEDHRSIFSYLRRCADKKARVTSELGFSAGTARSRTVQLVSEPVLDQRGEPAAYRTMLVDVSGLKNLEDRLRLLSEAGEQLASRLEPSAVPEAAARVLVPAFADFCMVDVVSETGVVERQEVRFADAKRQATLAELITRATPGRISPQARVIASGEPILLERGVDELRGRPSYGGEGMDALREAGLRSIMVVPLRARDHTLGALTLATVESRRRYDTSDLELAQAVAARVAMALDNAGLFAESRRANRELRLAEAKSSGIVSISADAIISIDEEQRITLFNAGAEKIFGYTRAEAIGAPLEILIPERFREVHRRHVERFAESEAVSRRMGEQGVAISGLRKSGEEFPADASISRLGVEGRRILTVVLRDVTERARIENEQRFLADVGAELASTLDLEGLLATVVGLALRLGDVCLIDIDEDGVPRRLEVATRDRSQQSACDVLKQVSIDRGRPSIARSVLETQRPMLVETVTPDVVASWAQSDEHLSALEALGARSVISVPLLARGRLVGVLTLVSSSRAYGPADLHLAQQLAYRAAAAVENARLYRLAEDAVRDRDEMLGVVAHDLRNPLWSILMQATLLRRNGIGPEHRLRRHVNAIERAANRMKHLIKDLLDVARMEAGRFSIDVAPVSVGALISELVESQRPLVSESSLDLRVDLAVNAGEVVADRHRLLQAFENLISNAARFTDPGGRITIGARPEDGEVVFWVSDTGTGIGQEALPHVFDRFWQARETPRQGAGLGLPIVKGIVDSHGGRVWVESEVGAGSTFFFTLPSARADRQARGAAAGAGDPAETRRPSGVVLVAEDDPEVREIVRDILEGSGYEVVTVTNGAEALEFLHREPLPSLIILDLLMPVMDGWAFLAERNRDPTFRSIPVIVVSGQRDIEAQVAAAHADFMQKPLLPERLIETVEDVAH